MTAALAASLVNGCGSAQNSDASKTSKELSIGDGGSTFSSSSPDAGDDGGVGHVLSGVHIVPTNAKLVVQAGQSASLPYTVMGIVDGAATEVDVTSRFVFYVPDNYLVGGFPSNGGPLFTTRLPATPRIRPREVAC